MALADLYPTLTFVGSASLSVDIYMTFRILLEGRNDFKVRQVPLETGGR